jgi:hypothetical protein
VALVFVLAGYVCWRNEPLRVHNDSLGPDNGSLSTSNQPLCAHNESLRAGNEAGWKNTAHILARSECQFMQVIFSITLQLLFYGPDDS